MVLYAHLRISENHITFIPNCKSRIKNVHVNFAQHIQPRVVIERERGGGGGGGERGGGAPSLVSLAASVDVKHHVYLGMGDGVQAGSRG